MCVLEETPLDSELTQIVDVNLKEFFLQNNILNILYEQNFITWNKDNTLLIPKKKKKGETVFTHWDEVKKLIDINGLNLQQWNKKNRQRWIAQSNNINQIEKLKIQGFNYQQIADTLSYIAKENGEFTKKLTSVLEPIAFKQYFEASRDNSTIVKQWE